MDRWVNGFLQCRKRERKAASPFLLFPLSLARLGALAGRAPFLFSIFIAIGCRHGTGEFRSELIYWSANNPYEQEVAREVVAEWNALHPDMPVHHQPIPEGQSSEEVILAAIAGRTIPDIYSNAWPGDVEFYVRARALIALDKFADFDSLISSRSTTDVVEQARSRDGHIYQMPWKTNPVMMMYNVKLFRQVGFDRAPSTYSEYLVAGKKLQDSLSCWLGIRDIRVLWWQRFFDFYPMYLAASGGKGLVDGDSVLFENESAVAVMSFLQTIYREGYFPKQKMTTTADFFLLGKVATRFNGPYEISHAEKFKPAGFEYDFAPMPVPDGHVGPVYTYGDLKNIVIFSTCQRPKAAWEFVKFMVSQRNDLRLLEIADQLPLRKGMLNDSLFVDYFAKNPRMIAFAQQAEYVRGINQSPVMKEVFDAISQEYEAAVVYAAKSPEKAVRDAAERVRLILE
jgi:multiple sugar transport system substrate-binding protein